jgi:glycosyltransferase involved in cell wall biosynthesis
MMSCVQEHYGPLLSKSVIPNCRRADLFQASRKEPIIFSAGRLWDQAKNVGLLDKIAPDLPWPVYLAGDGFGAQHANTLGQLSPVETGGWLSRASIYAMPARYEPFGLSVLEAALSGCALVLSDIESLRENWQDAALCIPPDDEEQWRSVLCDLANLPEHRQELASRARRRAIEFSPSRTARLYLGLYEDLIRQQEATRKRAMVI